MGLIVRQLGLCPYPDALALQEDLVGRKLAGDPDDYLLLLEHPPVFTLGRGADAGDLQGADARLGIPVCRVGRGGGVTYHGPGQLVAYPIVSLAPVRRDVRAYVDTLTRVGVSVCATFGIEARVRPETPGVWVGPAKVASVGIGIRRWVTYHGIALNVTTDLDVFDYIVPCRDASMRLTSLARLLPSPPSLAAVQARFEACFRNAFGFTEAAALEAR